MDAVIEDRDRLLAVEIKATARPTPRDVRHLRTGPVVARGLTAPPLM